MDCLTKNLRAKLKALAEAAESVKSKSVKQQLSKFVKRSVSTIFLLHKCSAASSPRSTSNTWTKEELVLLFVKDSTGQVQEIVPKKTKAAKEELSRSAPALSITTRKPKRQGTVSSCWRGAWLVRQRQ